MFVYLAFAVVFYLIPASLISAELGGAFADRRGGIYAWVAEAFGTRWGFLAIRLRYSAPALPRPFTVPGGLAGMWLTAGIGCAGVLFSFVVSFFPPDRLPVGSPWFYTGLVVLGIVVLGGIPLIIHHVRRSDWATVHDAPLARPAVIPLK